MHRLASFISTASNPKIFNCTAKRFYTTAVLLTVLSPLVTGCSTGGSQAALSPSAQYAATNNPKPVPEQATPQAPPQADPYPDATSKAIGAATISQSAHSSDDWKLVAQMWQEAIALMKSVPNTSSNYAVSRKKAEEYQRNLAYANKQVIKPVAPVVATTEPVIQQASFSSLSTPTIAAKSRPSAILSPVHPQPKQSTIEDKEQALQASAIAFMNDYFNQAINKGMRGDIYSCAETFELSSSLYSPESAKILETMVAPDGSMAWVTARIESSTNFGNPIRKNWKFTLAKGDTYVEKQMLNNGSKEGYKYSKSKYGGWCVQLLAEE
ncbi:MAG: hypothetical protein V7L31_24065 [Nostoc sp.]|uniref:hypothetical protein n=1 Tax=Nostoc sp. TaxID=1180 RepID=UPI002FF1D2E7